uniref:Uncharacterized protein n=1 Tax=Candidatus Kentrum sp. LPFa TaxID=2126335 RepID=A0A450WBS0_9GAMM|nr:MAG: hypothetical protein BECKLPF1236B_GA0070989_106211 [Candidatus Kentron sp. LPFa]
MKQQPRLGRRVDKRSASTISSFPVDARSDPPYAGTFFICWGDETLNMIVRYRKNKNPQKIGACARNTPFGAYCYALTCSLDIS